MPLQRLRPILWTEQVPETITFYENILGFTCSFRDERFAALLKDGVEIMIIKPSDVDAYTPGITGTLYIDTDQVDELWETLKDKVRVQFDIQNMDQGMREFGIYDNNGYVLVFGQELCI